MGFRLANVDDRAVLVDGDSYHDVEALSDGAIGPDPMAAIAEAGRLHDLGAAVGDADPTGSVGAARLGAPIPRPRNVFGIGLNYRSHVAESSLEVPTTPVVFTKFPSCISPPNSTIEIGNEQIDYEAELVVVVGPGGRDIAEADAWDHVAGLTAGQDVSDRGLQFASKPPHFDLGKSRDTFGPIGPWVVSPDLVDDRSDLGIRCSVNGETRQSASTADMIFSIPELIAYLSAILTLGPGDLIFTGTPAGVGMASGTFLRAGDEVETVIDGIGSFANRCVAR